MDAIYLQIIIFVLCVGIGALSNRNKFDKKTQKVIFVLIVSMSLICLFINDRMIVAYMRMIFYGIAGGWALTGKWGRKK